MEAKELTELLADTLSKAEVKTLSVNASDGSANALFDRLPTDTLAHTLSVKLWALKAEALIHSVTYPHPEAGTGKLSEASAM